MPIWQDRVFMFLQRNASDPTDFFHIPPGKVWNWASRSRCRLDGPPALACFPGRGQALHGA